MKEIKDPESVIYIVSGLPRSGTSLAMQLLQAAGIHPFTDGIRMADRHNQRGYFESNRVLHLPRDNSWLHEANGKALKVITALMRYLPDHYQYKLLFMERSLKEVVRSQTIMLDSLQKKGAGLPEERLIEIYSRELESFWKWLDNKPNFETMKISYNELMKEPRAILTDLTVFCGSRVNPEDLRSIPDSSLYRSKTD